MASVASAVEKLKQLAPAGAKEAGHETRAPTHYEKGLQEINAMDIGPDAVPMYYKRHALDTLPARLPEDPSPSDVVYQNIHDLCMLDANPRLNLASYLTTWMEKEAQALMTESMSVNHADGAIYPSSNEIEDKCVHILADLFHADNAMGCATIGSTEACLLGGLNMKKRWVDARRAKGLPTDKPNVILSYTYQVCWSKFARYWDVEMRLCHLKPGSYVLRPEEVEGMADENTIGIVAILGNTYTGHFDDVQALDAMCDQLRAAKGLDLVIHVDGASGGLVAPFLYPQLVFDFRLKNVISICCSGHKYGFVYPGVGWQIWRGAEVVHPDMVFELNYLGSDQKNLTLNFSRPASQIVASYYQFLRLGRRGFSLIMNSLQKVAAHLADGISALGMQVINNPAETIPVVVFHLLPYEPGQVPYSEGEQEGAKEAQEESEESEESEGEGKAAAGLGTHEQGCKKLGKQGAGGTCAGGLGRTFSGGRQGARQVTGGGRAGVRPPEVAEEGSESDVRGEEEAGDEEGAAVPHACKLMGRQGAGGAPGGGMGRMYSAGSPGGVSGRGVAQGESQGEGAGEGAAGGKVVRPYTEFEFVEQLKQHGWSVPAYKLAPDCDDTVVCRCVIREDFSITLADELLKAMKTSLQWLDAHFAGRSRAERDQMAERTKAHAPHKAPSELAKAPRTHVVC